MGLGRQSGRPEVSFRDEENISVAQASVRECRLTKGSGHTVKNNFGIPQRHFLRVNNFPLAIPWPTRVRSMACWGSSFDRNGNSGFCCRFFFFLLFFLY